MNAGSRFWPGFRPMPATCLPEGSSTVSVARPQPGSGHRPSASGPCRSECSFLHMSVQCPRPAVKEPQPPSCPMHSTGIGCTVGNALAIHQNALPVSRQFQTQRHYRSPIQWRRIRLFRGSQSLGAPTPSIGNGTNRQSRLIFRSRSEKARLPRWR